MVAPNRGQNVILNTLKCFQILSYTLTNVLQLLKYI